MHTAMASVGGEHLKRKNPKLIGKVNKINKESFPLKWVIRSFCTFAGRDWVDARFPWPVVGTWKVFKMCAWGEEERDVKNFKKRELTGPET